MQAGVAPLALAGPGAQSGKDEALVLELAEPVVCIYKVHVRVKSKFENEHLGPILAFVMRSATHSALKDCE